MERPAAIIRLKKGREKPVLNHHPWIFSGAIAKVEGETLEPGDLVDIYAHDGKWLAVGYYNPTSQIVVRILSWIRSEKIAREFWIDRISRAVELRAALALEPETNAFRLVNAESDLLPGLIIDKYGEFLVLQCLTLGVDKRRELIVESLIEVVNPGGVLERSDAPVRKLEGLGPVTANRYGKNPPAEHVILENGRKFGADLFRGHKTGLYLDQRDNRRIVCHKRYLSGHSVLNVFSYTGGFSVYAASNNAAQITNIDVSDGLLTLARRNMALNDFDRPNDEFVTGNAFDILRNYRDSGRQFDMVILDPPKFAHRQRDVNAACRGYKDLNWLAFRLLKTNGILATFSCSGLVSSNLFQKVIFGAAVDAKRDVQIIRKLAHSPDHPVLLTFPEAAYLKGFLCRVQ
jgi:23S rRNA (cytosine1962-C5)-methyltransferase